MGCLAPGRARQQLVALDRLAAARRTKGGVRSHEGGYHVARLQGRQLAGAKTAGLLAHADLEDALARYQRGVGLLRHCQTTLGDAEQRVRMLEGDGLTDFPTEPTRDGDEAGA